MTQVAALNSLERHAQVALITILLLGGIVFVWGMRQPLSGAVVATGVLAVESAVKKIQHQTGGIVKSLAVSEGTRVKAAQAILELDDTATRASLAVLSNELRAARAQLARLTAERDNEAVIVFPSDLVEEAANDETTRGIMADEEYLLRTRLANRHGQQMQLGERIEQLAQRIEGLEMEKRALERQRALAGEELASLHDLIDQKLVLRTRVTELQRELIRLEGAIGGSIAQIAEARSRQSEIRVQILGLDQDAARDVAKEIREVETRVNGLSERRVAALDSLQRTTIYAPEDGLVHQLAVHTVGGVVNPGEVLMLIVPRSNRFIVEAKVRPVDIDRVQAGQETRLILTGMAHRREAEMQGTVFREAADLSYEGTTNSAYYAVGIRLREPEAGKPPLPTLVPGMPVDVYIQTGERTLFDYLFSPLRRQFDRALRDN